jgi:hypothetical protein
MLIMEKFLGEHSETTAPVKPFESVPETPEIAVEH